MGLSLVLAGLAAPAKAGPALLSRVAEAGGAGEAFCAAAGTMQELLESWGRKLHELTPDVHVLIDKSSTLSAEGIIALLEGRVNCAAFVREPFPSEIQAFKEKFGYAPALINVANGSYDTKGGTHAIAVYVNAANPLQRLDLSQLDAIFSSTLRRGASHGATAWGDVGLPGDWARRPIHVYGMLRKRDSGNPPGIMNFLNQRVLLGGEFRDDLREQKGAPGESALQAIVNRVAEDPDGIGFSGFGFARANVKRVAVGETPEGPFYAGSVEEVQSRRYPLSRQIYILVNQPPGQPMSLALRQFLLLALSPEGQAIVAADSMHFIPLTTLQIQVAQQAIR
jgi:phosphate transport system substrate-binding protein